MTPADATADWTPLPVTFIAELMGDTPCRWWLSGGVGLDRFLGHVTRAHGDVDVSVQRSHWPELRRRIEPVLEVFAAVDGRLSPLSGQATGPDVDNLWARFPGAPTWSLQLNLEDVDGDEWIYRRHRLVRRPVDEVVWMARGVPTVRPAVQLLWQAKDPQPKDEHDLGLVLPRLPQAELDWLAGAIGSAHPGSPWLARPEFARARGSQTP